MKKLFSIKKIMIFLLCLGSLFIVTGCDKQETNNEDVIQKSYDALNIGDTSAVVSSLSLPKSDEYGVSFVWTSSNTDYLKNDGTIIRPEHGVGNKIVILTCTLTLDQQIKSKQFNVTILEKEAAPLNLNFDVSVGFTDSSVSGGIKFTAIPIETSLKVYYAITLKDAKVLTAQEIIDAKDEAIKASGSSDGGFVAYAVGDLDYETEYDIYVVIANSELSKIGEVSKIEAISSVQLFFNGANIVELGYIPIYNLRDLEEFARGFGTDYAFNVNVKLMNDIDMSEAYGEGKKNWTPLEVLPNNPTTGQDVSGTEYQGVFDGQNHIINGLYCHSDAEFVGFFKKVDTKANVGKVPAENPPAQILNLTFTNVDIQATYNPDCGRVNEKGTMVYSARAVGAVAGFFRGGRIENVHVIGGTIKSIDQEIACAGGLVGWVESCGWQDGRGDVTLTIENCSTDVEVIADGESVGGLVGQFDEGSAEETRTMLITNCLAFGNVTGGTNVGGLVGMLRGQMINSVAYGDVKANLETGVAGGCVGYLRTLIKKSSLYETKLVSVAYMGSKIEGATVNPIVYSTSKHLVSKSELAVVISNLYYNSIIATEFEDLSAIGITVNGISIDDFVAKTNVIGFENWVMKERDGHNVLVFGEINEN